MKQGYWRAEARRVIADAYAVGLARGLIGETLYDHVNAAYPFGPRAYHPYKMWCSEMQRRFNPERTTPEAVDAAKLAAWNAGAPIRG